MRDNTITNFFGVNMNKKINKDSLLSFNNTIGLTKLKNNNEAFITGSSDVLSSSFEVNYELKNIFNNDKFNVSFSQPNKVEKGEMNFRFIGLSDKNGIIPYTNHSIELSPSGRQKDIVLSYYKKFNNGFNLGLKSIVTDDLGHVKKSKIDSNFIVTGSLKF